MNSVGSNPSPSTYCPDHSTMNKSAAEWDQHYQDLHTPWDHGTAAPAITEVIEREKFPPATEVLVLGCGYGHDTRAFSEAGCHGTGLDLSARAMEIALEKASADLLPSTFIQGDLFNPELPQQKRYDVIWEHTCFCAISLEMRADYAKAVYQLLQPEGTFVGLFYTDTGNPPGEGPPFNVDREEIIRLFSPYFTLQWEKFPDEAYPNRIGREWLMCWKRRETR